MITLIFLHGIGEGNIDGKWLEALNNALTVMDYPPLEVSSVIAPRSVNLLKQEPSPHCPMPKYTVKKLAEANTDQKRWAYERRQASLEKILNKEEGNGDIFNDVSPELAKLVLSIIKQAERYVNNEGLRGCVLQTVLDKLPIFGEEVVIIGHSLGSLVAIDLLDHLPSNLIVRRLVTIGSPAGHVIMHGIGERLLKEFPISQVQSWVNVWSILDPVPFGKGIAQLFPYALDVRINLGMGEHSADKYLADERVARAVGEGVFGSRIKEIMIVPTDLDIPLDDNEKMILASLAYGHLLGDSITNSSRKARFQAALNDVQRNIIIRLTDYYNSKERSLPKQLASLGDGQRPDLNSLESMFNLRQSISVFLVIVSNNIIAPFEIKVSEDQRKISLELLAEFMGFIKDRGTAIFEALETARDVVYPKSGWLWMVLGLVGLALLLAGPIGLVLAAPAGLSGAAAIVSALAAFGPGGMLGGLITAGALAGTGGGAIAMAVAVASASVETFEAVVVLQLAIAIASHNLKERRDTDPWYALCGLEAQIAHELQRLETYSDKDSSSLKNTRRKKEAVRRALNYMVEQLGYKYETIFSTKG